MSVRVSGCSAGISVVLIKYTGNVWLQIKILCSCWLVGWLVRWLVCPAFTRHWEGGSGRMICQKNCPGHGINLARIISGSGHMQGA